MVCKNLGAFLAPPPPDRHSGEYHGQRQQELADDPDPVKLSAGHGDPPVFLLLWTDGDQIFIRGQPVDGVQREVTVAVEPDERICSPRRAAHHHKSALRVLLARVVGPRRGQGQRTLFVFRVARINLGRTQICRRQAALGRAEQFLDRGLSRVFDLQRPRDWEPCRRSLHFVHNRVSVVAADQGHLGADADELANRVQVQDQVLIYRDAPALQKTGKGIVVGYFRPAHFQGGIEQEQRAAAILEILLDRINFRLLILAGGAADHKHCAIAGNLGLLQQADRFRVVVIFAEKFLETGIPASFGIINLMFPAAGHKTNGPRVVLQIANEGAGDAFLGHALCFFFFYADLNESRAVILHAGCAYHLGVFVHVYIFDVNPAREVRVAIEHVFGLLEPRGLVKIGDGRILLQPLDDFRGLFGQGVPFIGGRVIRPVVTVRENVRYHHGGKGYGDIDRGVSRVLCLPRFEEPRVHLRPPAQRFHRAGSEKQPQEYQRHVIDGVLRVEHASGKRFKMNPNGHIRENAGPCRSLISGGPIKNPKRQAGHERYKGGYDLIPAQSRNERTNCQQGTGLKHQPYVANDDRLPIRAPVAEEKCEVERRKQ